MSKNINAPRYTLKKLFKNFCQFVKETHLEQFNITKVANSITSQVIPKELFSKKALNSCLCSCFVLFLHCRFGKHDPISFDLLNFPINYLPNISAYTFQTTPPAYTFLWKTGSASTRKAAEESYMVLRAAIFIAVLINWVKLTLMHYFHSYQEFIFLITVNPVSPSVHLFAIKESKKEALEHFKHAIKICPNRGDIF